jgi:Ca2+-binding RTX toxin-like protein
MKRSILIAFAILVALPASVQAKPQTFNVLLAGGSGENMIRIWLTPDGRQYAIASIVPLEVGGSICANPEGAPNELLCEASSVGSFEVNAGDGDDYVAVARNVSVPVTLRGGAGDDHLVGGSGDDKLIGGPGEDRLLGWGGRDRLYGGRDGDRSIGGRGEDLCGHGIGDRVSGCEVLKEGR